LGTTLLFSHKSVARIEPTTPEVKGRHLPYERAALALLKGGTTEVSLLRISSLIFTEFLQRCSYSTFAVVTFSKYFSEVDDAETKTDTTTMTKEERNLAKMVMPKKKKRLLEKIEYSKRKKASEVRGISVQTFIHERLSWKQVYIRVYR
jgi:hypothetical protein